MPTRLEEIAKTRRCKDAEKRILFWQFSASLRLCASAVAFGVGNEPVFAIDSVDGLSKLS